MGTESDSPNSSTIDEEGTTDEEQDENNNRQKPTKLSLRAGKISVEAESVEDSLEEMADVCSQEMECLMRYHIRGELEMLEEEDLHGIILGDD